MKNERRGSMTGAGCIVCWRRMAKVKQRCWRCYAYFHATGRERPQFEGDLRGLARQQHKPCIACTDRLSVVKGRCMRCDSWFRDHGTERPKNFGKVKKVKEVKIRYHLSVTRYTPVPESEWKSWYA